MKDFLKKHYPAFLFVSFMLLSFLGSYFFLKPFRAYAPEVNFSFSREKDNKNTDSELVDVVDSQNNDIPEEEETPEQEAEEEQLETDISNLQVQEDDNENGADQTAENSSPEPEENNDLSLPDCVPVVRASNELSIGFITDLHVQETWKTDGTIGLKNTYLDRLNTFVEKMNNETVPQFLIVNGDLIEGTSWPVAMGIRDLKLTKKIFYRTKIPTYWVLGNHDLRSVTKAQWQASLGINYLQKSFEMGDYKIIILDSNYNPSDKDVTPGKGYLRGRVSEKEISWLKKELKNTDKKVIVFMHHPPLWNVDVKPNTSFPDNTQELRDIFATKHVLAVFSGHIEDLYYEKSDGVHYFVLPGIYKNPEYPGSFSEINIKDDKITVLMSYLKNGTEYQKIKIKSK